MIHRSHNFSDHLVHVHIAIQVIFFIKISLFVSSRASQMNKMYAIRKTPHHIGQIIVFASADQSQAWQDYITKLRNDSTQRRSADSFMAASPWRAICAPKS